MILAILQARMTSTRLPGKVMRELAGAPMIVRQIERLRRSRRIERLVVATSDQETDDELAALVRSQGVSVHRGELDDVLGRFAGALEAFGPTEHVVRLTGDCPLTEPEVIDDLIALHLDGGGDYANNTGGRRTFPHGLDAEVMRADVLRQAAEEAVELYEREHVTPFIYRRPERFRLAVLTSPHERGELRWTVDTPDDFEFVREVYEALYPENPGFGPEDVLRFVASRPDLARLGGYARGETR